MEISIITTSILALFYVFLAMRIGYFRGSPVMKLIFQKETKGTPEILERNVRAHGNFIEYVPLFLILLMLSESNGSLDNYWLKVFTIAFCVGRLNHAVCFAFFTHNPFLRISGMLLTYTGIIALAVSLLMFAV